MKKLILTGLLIAGTAVFAQEKVEVKQDNSTVKERRISPEKRVDLQVSKMTTDLSLDEKQAKQVKALLLDENKMREAQRANMQAKRASGVKPTQEERDAMRAKMQEGRNDMETKMKSILTADQFTKWQQKRELKKAEMLEKRDERIEKIRDTSSKSLETK